MRSHDEYRQILQLWEAGKNKSQIANIMDIPRSTVRDCIHRYESVAGLESATSAPPAKARIVTQIHSGQVEETSHIFTAYAFLLGMYLGDGYIIKQGRTYWLRITLSSHYPQIIASCVEAVQAILPDNRVRLIDRPGDNTIDVSCHSNHWCELFPQHGKGKKHQREITLEDWQQRITEQYPLAFFKGLYYSDGSRFSNVVNGKDYPRYQFTNYSEDIVQIFCDTCDILGIHWTQKSHGRDIFISKRGDVEYLDHVIGPKC